MWPQVAPILFPVVGWTNGGRARHAGVTYPLGLHGFAAERTFCVVEADAHGAWLRLEADPWTRAKYPFAFRLDAVYALEPDALVWTLEATNRGDEPMPYALGLHPGFCWPLAGSTARHTFTFDRPERADVPVIAPGGLFSSERRRIAMTDARPPAAAPLWAPPSPLQGGLGGAAAAQSISQGAGGGYPHPDPARKGEGASSGSRGKRLPLTSDLLAQEALCFLDIASRGAVYDNGAGAQLRVDLDGFPHVALWARPPAQYLCIEAWTGHGDPVGFSGELKDKPSMRLLAPGQAGRHIARFTFSRTD